jgi:hypothetical protein
MATFPIPEATQSHLDLELRERVSDAVAEFDRSFAAAAAHPTGHNLDKLRDATDRMLRAGARVLIEIDRI